MTRTVRLSTIPMGAVLVAGASVQTAALAAHNPLIINRQARFTVIAPECVRLEFSAAGRFTDEPTLFASERGAREDRFTVTRERNRAILDTGRIRIEYTPDGKPFSPTNLRATIRHNEETAEWTPGLKSERNLGGPISTLDEIAGPVPLSDGLLSRDGWYLLDDTDKPILVDGWIAARPSDRGLDWYLFGYGRDFKAAFSAFTKIGGRIPLPRKHVLGSWYCRWWDYSADEFRDIVRQYREHDFPLDILVMDMGWHRQDATWGYGTDGKGRRLGWTGYSWNPDLIKDPKGLLSELKQDRLFVTLNDHPHDGIRSHEDSYADFMRELQKDPATGENLRFNAGDRRYMDAFFKWGHRPHEEIGVDFWWLDWQQDEIVPWVPGVTGLRHLPWLNEIYYRHAAQGNRRGLSFSRWGGFGDHRHPIHFSGDSVSSWAMLKFEIELTALSGNAGCFFWAHDIGGFMGDRLPENYARWTQFGALSASLRIHSTKNASLDRRPWLWGESLERSMRSAYHLRSQLMPYIYSSVWQAHSRSLPLLRPMYIEYPNTDDAYASPQQYLFGDLVLAAPITSGGAGSRLVATQDVWFPEGNWYNLFSAEKLTGDRRVTVRADIDELPLFVRGGFPLPMQPATARMGSDPLTTLTVRAYPGREGGSGSFTLYEDDGQSRDYEKGGHALTDLTYERTGDRVRLLIAPVRGSYSGQPQQRAYRIELPATQKATDVQVDGVPAAAAYDATTWTNLIAIPERSIEAPLTIEVTAADADPKAIAAVAADRRHVVPPPEVLPIEEISVSDHPVVLALRRSPAQGEIRYTLDGSEPDGSSRLFDRPFAILAPAEAKLVAFEGNYPKSSTLTRQFLSGDMGLSFRYFEGEWESLPDFVGQEPLAGGIVNGFDLVRLPSRDDRFGAVFQGFIRIDKNNDYTFYLTSDDGSRLFIDGKLVVDNDGRHGIRERTGKIALTAGLHPLRLEYFQYTDIRMLRVEYEAPGMPPRPVPPTALFHRPPGPSVGGLVYAPAESVVAKAAGEDFVFSVEVMGGGAVPALTWSIDGKVQKDAASTLKRRFAKPAQVAVRIRAGGTEKTLTWQVRPTPASER